MPVLPNPALYNDWKEFAQRLVDELEFTLPVGNNAPVPPDFSAAALPSAKQNGVIIFVKDAPGGAKLALSVGGAWLYIPTI